MFRRAARPNPPRVPRRSRLFRMRFVFAGLLLAAATAVVSGERLLRFAAGALVVREPVAEADAIYVLGGEREFRGAKAAELFHEGLAGVILVPREPVIRPRMEFEPAADPPLVEMLRSGIWRPGTKPGEGLRVSQRLPGGTYDVSVYFAENHRRRFRRMELRLEGRTVDFPGDLPFGHWRRYGPYRVAVGDGALNVDLLNAGKGDPCLMGLEVKPAPEGRGPRLGINFGGKAVRIRGRRWLAEEDARTRGLEVGGVERFSEGGRSPTDILALLLENDGVPRERIIELDHPDGVRSTADEAAALAAFARRTPISRVLVVTSAYHTRRAQWTLERGLEGLGVDIRMVAVPDASSGGDSGMLRRSVTEYGKLAAYWGLHQLGMLLPGPDRGREEWQTRQ